MPENILQNQVVALVIIKNSASILIAIPNKIDQPRPLFKSAPQLPDRL
jgi:hypothetical protein